MPGTVKVTEPVELPVAMPPDSAVVSVAVACVVCCPVPLLAENPTVTGAVLLSGTTEVPGLLVVKSSVHWSPA